MPRDQSGGDDLEPEEFDPAEVETTDGAWERAGTRSAHGWGRWLLLLLVIAVVALVVQHVQPGDGPSASSAPTDRSTSGPTTSHVPAGRTGAVLQPPATAGPGRVVVRPGGPGVRRIPGRWSLLALTNDAVVRLDFAHDRVVETRLPALQSAGPVSFLATSAGAVVRPMDCVPGYLVPDDAPPHPLTGLLSHCGPAVPGPDPDAVWAMVGEGDHTAVALVTVDGRPDGPSLPMPDNVQGWIRPGGGGYPLLPTSGGVYAVRPGDYGVHPGGLRRITTGEVLAVGATGWLVVECDGRNRCSRVVVDRASGRRRTLPGTDSALATGYDTSDGRISPDGSYAALIDGPDNGPDHLRLIDLRTGGTFTRPIGPVAGDSGAVVAWSPDGSRLFVAQRRGEVLVVEPDHPRRRASLGLEIPGVAQLAVRRGAS